MNPPTPDQARDHFDAWRARVARNAFEADPHLKSLLALYGHEDLAEGLSRFGGASATLDALVRENNRDENLPRLRRYDGQGNRLEAIDFHPTYHEIGRIVYGTGLMGMYREPGNEVGVLSYMYLVAQNGEAGHACPLACTAGLIKILQADDAEHDAWLQKLYNPDYDTHFHGSQFLTEVQGGSDVGANAVVATPAEDGSFRITGEKWFCSVIDAHLFLVTARPEGQADGTRGLRAFVVPRSLPDGRVNDFVVRRLKYKLGTRSMASAEVDFQGAVGFPVGNFHQVVGIVLNTSRLFNAAASAGIAQRAWREADAYARHRMAFGQPILRFPAVARTVAQLRTQAYAIRSVTFALAHLSDRMHRGDASDSEAAAWRMLVNLNKYWTSIAGTTCVRDAIEVFGGNGAIEEFTVLPRLLRDSIVCEAWEGSHNVLCAQTLRDSRRLGLHRPTFAWLDSLSGGDPRLDAIRARWERLLELPEAEASLHIRDVVDELGPVAQAIVLGAEAAREGSDPLLPTVIDHLLTTTARGYDPMQDATLAARIEALIEP